MSVMDPGTSIGLPGSVGSVAGVIGGPTPLDVSHGSLRTRLREKRRRLAEDNMFELPVPGFAEEGIWARYRVLRYEDLRQIGENNKNLKGFDSELAIAADTLAWASAGLLLKKDDGSFEELGYYWTAEAARELFGVEGLSDDSTNSHVFQQIFDGPSGTTNIMLHFVAYDQRLQGLIPELDEAMRGELGARIQRASSS